MNILIIYHAHCNDGKTAAAVALGFYRSKDYEVSCYAAKYGEPFPELAQDYFHKVLVVDFSYHGEDLIKLSKVAPEITILDHHRTAIEKIREMDRVPDNIKFVLDETRSGAMLAWDHLYECDYHPIVLDVGMRDLWVDDWKNKYPNALGLHLALPDLSISELGTMLYSDHALGKLSPVKSQFYHNLSEKGKAIVKYVDGVIDDHIEGSNSIILDHMDIMAVNCSGHIISELAEKLKDKCDAVMGYNIGQDLNVHLSFRSVNGQAKKLAELFGGGGHPNAAGAQVSFEILKEILYGRR